MRVSFDYDGTLNRYDAVVAYAKELVGRGIDVWICTARYFEGSENFLWGKTSNDDIYTIARECVIPISNIIFTNMKDKSSYLTEMQPIWHLDDDDYIIGEVRENSLITAIDVKSPSWKYDCEAYIDTHK